MPLKQPARRPEDGAVNIRREDDDHYTIEVTTNGVTQAVLASGFNAWRVVGMLAMMVGIPLPSWVGRAIKL